MANEDRHANAGGGELDCRVQYLLGFHHHLPFFRGRSIVQEDVDVGDDVEGNLLGELLGLRRVADENVTRLRSEEHTSELQSLMRISYAVFCLKKNTIAHTRNFFTSDSIARYAHTRISNCLAICRVPFTSSVANVTI